MRAAGGSRKSANPYVQALLTYPRRVRSWARLGYLIVGGVLFLFVPCVLVFVVKEPRMFLFFSVYLFVPLALHVKGQFADPRADLMPGFRRAHAIVAAGWVLLLAVVLPAMLTWLWHVPSVSLVALTLCVLGLILWAALRNPALLGILFCVAMFAAISEPGSRALDQLFSGQLEILAAALLIIGLAVTLWAGFRLVCLNEDMPEYRCRMPMGWQQWTTAIGGQPANERGLLLGFWNWFAERNMARLTRHARRRPPRGGRACAGGKRACPRFGRSAA